MCRIDIQVLKYLESCLALTAGVTEEDKVKNRFLVPISRYILDLLKEFNNGLCDFFCSYCILNIKMLLCNLLALSTLLYSKYCSYKPVFLLT